MSGHEFMLPNELGWKANDDVRKCIADWLTKVGTERQKKDWATGNEFKLFMDVAIAELSDDVYATIKKYQAAKENAQ